MKTAVYIEQGVLQIVVTPENEFEKSLLKIPQGEYTVKAFRGVSFYATNGGWIRESKDDESLVVRIDPQPTTPIPGTHCRNCGHEAKDHNHGNWGCAVPGCECQRLENFV